VPRAFYGVGKLFLVLKADTCVIPVLDFFKAVREVTQGSYIFIINFIYLICAERAAPFAERMFLIG